MTPQIMSVLATAQTTGTTATHAAAPGAVTQLAFPQVAAAVVPFVLGLLLVLGLVWAVRRGTRFRRGEPGPRTPPSSPGRPAPRATRDARRRTASPATTAPPPTGAGTAGATRTPPRARPAGGLQA
ncbi:MULTISPECIES: DUF6479 family protein [unclassified Streptomyces]|uniref:DUF6479 family protein n=1 Tax=unclassified Streptomyces TaxID=2593676 RepID=UPI00114CAB72|nr:MULTISPECIES: DUF6479 family protein [unclassified Streptomyces]MYQ68284.1 hypothetical protein [Streptomyces sp. SID4950]